MNQHWVSLRARNSRRVPRPCNPPPAHTTQAENNFLSLGETAGPDEEVCYTPPPPRLSKLPFGNRVVHLALEGDETCPEPPLRRLPHALSALPSR